MRKMIVDTDTASDDAVALLMALRAADVEVEAITIVAGNVPVAQGSRNARLTVELCGKTTPVYEGCGAPLLREAYPATFFHGPDGMGGAALSEPQRPPAAGHAVDVLIETIRQNPGILLVTLGPLTNVAAALIREPGLARQVSRCVVMGGAACCVGNVTPAAEYNIWCDPEAARICFHSGLPIEMVGWELCRGAANLLEPDIRQYRTEIDTRYSHFVIDINQTAIKVNREWLGDPGIALPDPVAMAIALDPSICTRSSRHFVEVECAGTFTRGMTVVDELGVTRAETDNVAAWRPLTRGREPNVTVCWQIDVERWKGLLRRLVQ